MKIRRKIPEDTQFYCTELGTNLHAEDSSYKVIEGSTPSRTTELV